MNLKNYIKYISLVAIVAINLITVIPTFAATAVASDKSVTAKFDIILLTKPQCEFKASNEQGRVSKGLTGVIVLSNYTTIKCYNGENTYVKVSFTAGTGANRDTVTGYVNTKELIITTAILKPAEKSIAVRNFKKPVYVKPDCNFVAGSTNDKAKAVGALPGTINGITDGAPTTITCPAGPVVFYKIKFAYTTALEFHELAEGTTGFIKSTDIPRSFSSFTKPMYIYPSCVLVKGSKNDAAAGKLAINGNVLGAVILTCNGVTKTFYKVVYNYSTKVEFHEGYIAYILSTDL